MAWQIAPALAVLRSEINALYPGRDKRTDGTISGYPGSISSHNVNSLGYVCALDVTVGDYPGGITPTQAEALTEQIRVALRDQPRGVVAYIIYNRRIADGGNDSPWRYYSGSDPHTNHFHVSVDTDIYAGQPPSGYADYMTQASWGLTSTTVSGQSGDITPITPKEDTLSEVEVQAINEFTQSEIQKARATIVAEIRAGIAATGDTIRTEAYSGKVFAQATANANGDRVIIDHRAQVAGLVEAIKQLSLAGGAPVDLGAVLDAARRGAAEAIAEGVVKVDISIAKPDATVGAEK